jgi:hypothetical protein
VRKVVAIVLLAIAAALVGAVAVDRQRAATVHDPRPTSLVATRLIPAGTPGEAILGQPWRYVVNLPIPETRLILWPQAEPIVDPAYLGGRVAIVDILPGTRLQKADFRLPVAGAPGWTLGEYSYALTSICARWGVEGAAGKLGVAPTPGAAAEAYARLVPEGPWRDAAYEGCLRGFGGPR